MPRNRVRSIVGLCALGIAAALSLPAAAQPPQPSAELTRILDVLERRQKQAGSVRIRAEGKRFVPKGGYTEAGYDGFWNGFIRNTVHGPVNLFGNVVADLDGNEVVTNTIFGSLNCAGNDPAPQVGDSEGSPNHTTGPETGQCVGL